MLTMAILLPLLSILFTSSTPFPIGVAVVLQELGLGRFSRVFVQLEASGSP